MSQLILSKKKNALHLMLILYSYLHYWKLIIQFKKWFSRTTERLMSRNFDEDLWHQQQPQGWKLENVIWLEINMLLFLVPSITQYILMWFIIYYTQSLIYFVIFKFLLKQIYTETKMYNYWFVNMTKSL